MPYSFSHVFRAQKCPIYPFMSAAALVLGLTLSLGTGPVLAAPGHGIANGGTPYGVAGKSSKVSRTIKIDTKQRKETHSR